MAFSGQDSQRAMTKDKRYHCCCSYRAGMWLVVVLLLVGSSAWSQQNERPATASPLPATVHCGRIVSVTRETDAVAWVDLEPLLVEGHLAAGTGDIEAATIERLPQPNMSFAIVEAAVISGRSLSKYDYQMLAAGRTVPCLGLSVDDGPFDPRRWKVTGENQVRMLFEIPADAATVVLEPALTLPIPLRTIANIPFGVQAPVDAGAGEGLAPATTAVQEPDADAEVAAEENPPQDGPKDATAEADAPEAKPDSVESAAPAEADEATEKPEPKPEPERKPAADVLDF